VRWRAGTGRTFFIVNPSSEIEDRAYAFVERWGPNASVQM
jgi:hypothetical protein